MMETIFGGLIEFPTKKEFETFLNSIDEQNSIKMLEMALEFGHRNGIYSMEEVHIIYKCLLILKNRIHENTTLSVNNTNGDSNN